MVKRTIVATVFAEATVQFNEKRPIDAGGVHLASKTGHF